MATFYNLIFVIIGIECSSLKLVINQQNSEGNGFYSVSINNETWLESGQMEGWMDNKWYTTNTSKATINNWGVIKLVSTSTTFGNDNFGGLYELTTYEWMAGIIEFETKFKIYSDGKAISFIQSFPNGVNGINLLNASQIVSNCNQDTEVPFLSFPSFNSVNKNSKYAQNDLGYLTWRDQQIQHFAGRMPISSTNMAGINGGVMVLYNNYSTIIDKYSLVISPVNHFSAFAQNNVNPTAIKVISMYNDKINDYMLCIGNDCYIEQLKKGYRIISNDFEGIAMSAKISFQSELDEVIPIHLWHSNIKNDHYISTKKLSISSDYEIIKQDIGYIYKYNDNMSTRLPLQLFYNEELKDYTMAGSNKFKQLLISKGYISLSIEGYIKNTNYVTESNTDWKLGTAATYLSIPEGYQHEIAIVIGNGINNAILDEFSSRIQSLYSTNKVGSKYDLATSYLGYWTDHGAYYYGDSYGQLGTMNLSCCSLEVFKDVKQKLDSDNIPIKYWQMDDWWYIGNNPKHYSNNWGGVKGVSHWEPPPLYYPGGLAALTNELQVPLLLYGPYFDPVNDWNGQFEFIPNQENTGYVLPTPKQSYSFYSTLFDFGINATYIPNSTTTGMIAYEIDFMNCLSHTPYFRLHIDTQEQWLYGINKAAEERGLIVQYCMTIPNNLMIALSLSQTTNARASRDYAGSTNWNIGPSNLIAAALAIKPSKDNFWTMFNEPVPPHYGESGNDYNSTEIHAISAILSKGPVGVSDGAGLFNKTLIMRTCASNGRLLQPSRSATAIDDQFVYSAFDRASFNIWQTYFGSNNNNNYFSMIYAIDLQETYILRVDSFYPSLNINYKYIIRNWHNYTNCVNNSMAIQSECVIISNENNNGNLYNLKPKQIEYPMHHSFELITVTIASFNKLIFMGELKKYVSVSENRFSNLNIEGMTITVDIIGGSNEIVQITILKPNTDQTDWIIYTYDVSLDKTGSASFQMTY